MSRFGFGKQKKGDSLEKTQEGLKDLQLKGSTATPGRITEQDGSTPTLQTRRGKFDFSPEEASFLLSEVFKKQSPEKKAFEALKEALKLLMQGSDDEEEEKRAPRQEKSSWLLDSE